MIQSRQGNHGAGYRPPRLSFGVSRPAIAIGALFLLSCFAISEATFAFFNAEDDPSFLSLKDPPRGTTGLALLPASPDCWLEAIQTLKLQTDSLFDEAFHATMDGSSEDGSHALNSITCSWMTAVDQKVLALELSKCHMKDLARPLFHFNADDDGQKCNHSLQNYHKEKEDPLLDYHSKVKASTSSNIAIHCLSHLTDAGVNTYTHFFSYVNQLCTRLLSEIVLGQYYETSHHLARSSKVAEAKIQALIEQQDVLFHRWNEREEHVLGMYDQLESHVEEQTLGLESKIRVLHGKLEAEHQFWKEEYKNFQEALATEFDRYQKEFAIFSRIIHKTQDFVSSWTASFYSLLKKIQLSYSLFQGISLNIAGWFCTWLSTLPRPFRWMRGCMSMILLLEVLVEIGILITLSDDKHHDQFWKSTYFDQCEVLRSWMFQGMTIYFVTGICRTVVSACRKNASQEGDDEVDEYLSASVHEDEPGIVQERVQNTVPSGRQSRIGMPMHPRIISYQSGPALKNSFRPVGTPMVPSQDESTENTETSPAPLNRSRDLANHSMVSPTAINLVRPESLASPAANLIPTKKQLPQNTHRLSERRDPPGTSTVNRFNGDAHPSTFATTFTTDRSITRLTTVIDKQQNKIPNAASGQGVTSNFSKIKDSLIQHKQNDQVIQKEQQKVAVIESLKKKRLSPSHESCDEDEPPMKRTRHGKNMDEDSATECEDLNDTGNRDVSEVDPMMEEDLPFGKEETGSSDSEMLN